MFDRARVWYDEDSAFHEYDDVFPLKKCMFGGTEMTCPNQPQIFLETVYGTNVMNPHKKCVNSTWITL